MSAPRCVLYFSAAKCFFCGREMRVVPAKTVCRLWGFIPITKVKLIREPGWTFCNNRPVLEWLIRNHNLQPPYLVNLCGICTNTAHATWEKEMKESER
jgi:hypothetical protein